MIPSRPAFESTRQERDVVVSRLVIVLDKDTSDDMERLICETP
jgi:hypothetical protein